MRGLVPRVTHIRYGGVREDGVNWRSRCGRGDRPPARRQNEDRRNERSSPPSRPAGRPGTRPATHRGKAAYYIGLSARALGKHRIHDAGPACRNCRQSFIGRRGCAPSRDGAIRSSNDAVGANNRIHRHSHIEDRHIPNGVAAVVEVEVEAGPSRVPAVAGAVVPIPGHLRSRSRRVLRSGDWRQRRGSTSWLIPPCPSGGIDATCAPMEYASLNTVVL